MHKLIHSNARLLKVATSSQQCAFSTSVLRFQKATEGVVPTKPIQTPSASEELVKEILNNNAEGRVAEAVEAYEKLKKMNKHIELKTLNSILSSFSSKKLLFKWFKPYKDYVDMYVEASKYRPQEVRIFIIPNKF